MVRWAQSEEDQANLGLIHIDECYWKDKDGKYWFNDETQVYVCGPYESLTEVNAACNEYSKTI